MQTEQRWILARREQRLRLTGQRLTSEMQAESRKRHVNCPLIIAYLSRATWLQ